MAKLRTKRKNLVSKKNANNSLQATNYTAKTGISCASFVDVLLFFFRLCAFILPLSAYLSMVLYMSIFLILVRLLREFPFHHLCMYLSC